MPSSALLRLTHKYQRHPPKYQVYQPKYQVHPPKYQVAIPNAKYSTSNTFPCLTLLPGYMFHHVPSCSIMLHTGAQACPGCCPGQNCLEQADQAGLLIVPAFYYLSSMLGCKMQMNIFSQQVCQGIRKGKNRDRLDQMKEFGMMKMQVTNILHSNLEYIFVFLHKKYIKSKQHNGQIHSWHMSGSGSGGDVEVNG